MNTLHGATTEASGSAGTERRALGLMSALYVLWAAVFIFRNSYIALDGQRYFGLFDDAMISMRYAWNLAHGLGLVWNAGERVEGYSNLLMTLLMSVPARFLEKKFAVLAIQIIGIPTVLGIAWLARRLSRRISGRNVDADLLGALTFTSVLLYFPISYWTLLGMETGLLTVLLLGAVFFGLRWLDSSRRSDLTVMALMTGLAFLTRNDSLILSLLLLVFLAIRVWQRQRDLRVLQGPLQAAMLLALFAIGQTVFRYLYYDSIVPNTFTLKLTHYPLKIRLIDGTRYVLQFLVQTWPAYLLAAAPLLGRLRADRLLLAALASAVIAYQIYVGGDPWVTWRMLAPGMPFVFILAAVGISRLVSRATRLVDARFSQPAVASIFLLAILIADLPFLEDMSVNGPTSAAIANRTNTNTAVAIMALTRPEASVGVIWAGTLPYYVDRYAIDYLGKSDPFIASLDADVSGSSGWGDQITIPGHNKYDLEYSIVKRRPTYSQAFSWGYATVRPYFVENYVRVEYHGDFGTKTLFLLKDSPLVCWEACRDRYQIIPWPK